MLKEYVIHNQKRTKESAEINDHINIQRFKGK